MLWVFGVGEIPISVSRSGADGTLVHTVRAVGAVSDALAHLGEGGVVGVRGPFGTGWDVESAAGDDVVVVGGGIGFAPLRPVVEHLLAHRDDYGHISVLVGARTPDEILFTDNLAQWPRPEAGIDVEITVDAARPGLGCARRRGDRSHRARAVRRIAHGRVRLRPRGHDAVRDARDCTNGACRSIGSDCRRSAT